MKILHTSDWHLGKIVMAQSMTDDQRMLIETSFLPALDRWQPDVIVMAGDVFDRSIAPVEAIRLWEDTLYAVAERGIPMLIISGNHDGADRLIPAARLMRQAGIYLARSLSDFSYPIDITARDGSRARFFTLPYFNVTQAADYMERPELKNPDEAFAALFETVRPLLADDCPNLLIAHCTVTGAITCDSESRIAVGGAEQVSSTQFDGFDFTLLGHIHSCQKAGSNAMYCGAPLRYSFDPNERDKCWLLHDTADGSVTRIPIVPSREMRTITGMFDELMDVPDNCTDDYIYAVTTDECLIYEPSERLRKKYPHLLGLRQNYLHRTLADSEGDDTLREKMKRHTVTDEEIMTSFLRKICHVEPLPEDIAFFTRVVKEIGEETT